MKRRWIMRDAALLPDADRGELFRATSQRMRVHEAIIEKDFWVCWVLDALFSHERWKEQLVFKGGTSLSKAYGIIDRFSEDIDLVLDAHALGIDLDEGSRAQSTASRNRFCKAVNEKAARFLAAEMQPSLAALFGSRAPEAMFHLEAVGQELRVGYPRAFAMDYVQPIIRLEVGPLAGWTPNELRSIRSYAATEYPALFPQAEIMVSTITAERTFWEKATLLHQEAHRDSSKPCPPRYSRHYYDLHRLYRSPVKAKALEELSQLHEVAEFKSCFYQCAWAKYEDAVPSTLRLSPNPAHLPHLRADYASMRSMLFGTVPDFDTILADLAALEEEIHGLA
jgi:hypothetical protein